MLLRKWLEQRKVNKLFPKAKPNFWYCGEIYLYSSELRQEGKPWKTSEMGLPCDRFIINPFCDSGGSIPRVGD